MHAPPRPSELERLRQTICDNTAKMDNVRLLRALVQLQEAWFAQVEQGTPLPSRAPSCGDEGLRLWAIVSLVWPMVVG